MKDNQKKWAQIVAKAWMDESFKKKLLNDPKGVMKGAGLKFDASQTIRIYEAKKNEFCFVLPAKPEGNLSEEELKSIAAAGGDNCYYSMQSG